MPNANNNIIKNPNAFILEMVYSGFLLPNVLAFQNIKITNIASIPPAIAPVNPKTVMNVARFNTAKINGNENTKPKETLLGK